MKTSVIEVRDMLSVLSVLGVEQRICEVPGVESATVNYAAGTATVRYDETRLEIAGIKSAVRQRAHESEATPNAEPVAPGAATAPAVPAVESHKDHPAPGAPPSTPKAAEPMAAPHPPAAVPAPADSAGEHAGTKEAR